jgi:hypothetical protein
MKARLILLLAMAISSGWVLPVLAQRVADSETVPVLDLDGSTGYVELPPAVFENLRDGTVEGWIRWRKFKFYTRFWDYGTRDDMINVQQGDNAPGLGFSFHARGPFFGTGGYLLQTNVPVHIAAAAGSGGMKLYVNGRLVGSNTSTKTFADVTPGGAARLGRDCWDGANYTDGQMAEVRVWSRQLSEEEIRWNMFKRLTGSEPGLRALWNFSDPANPGKDSSTNGFHGEVRGGARVVQVKPPKSIDEITPTMARLGGQILDASQKGVNGATVRVVRDGRIVASAVANLDGKYSVFLEAFEGPAWLVAKAGEASGCEPLVQVKAAGWHDQNLVLGTAPSISGRVMTYEPSGQHRVLVQLVAASQGHGIQAPAVDATLTAKNGTFSFGAVPPGDYRVRIQVPNRHLYFGDGEVVRFDGTTVSGINLVTAPIRKGSSRTFTVRAG